MTKTQIKKKITHLLRLAKWDYKSNIFNIDEHGELIWIGCFDDLTKDIEDYFDVDLSEFTCWLQNECFPTWHDRNHEDRWYIERYKMIKNELFRCMEVLSYD